MRVYVFIFDGGAYITSNAPAFAADFAGLVAQYGLPVSIEESSQDWGER